METDTFVKVTAEGKLELPAEIQAKLSPGDEYVISITEDEIVLKKIRNPLTWCELSQRLEESEPDLQQPSLSEISKLVKEMRREKRSKA
ncbi:AbrB/MazE/SpoVT family DNA-binding domain-containing protein [Nostoc sp. LPT]|uniref:AbrB/MazE/SpoVT family DNA-binding domain-containing protein n=1 Tax=Nostoc sp. LPT TaxID=2815387 RepID=UPI001E061B39|nr:AbrB/MazE/SpoVT family DNA-binding domain-containing protein [Nostoc sp. LPT]MBN4001792.1 AbrB/MazE/SpoVT family DNA-binding domain-containing protein [Nostoc sp. LPT]